MKNRLIFSIFVCLFALTNISILYAADPPGGEEPECPDGWTIHKETLFGELTLCDGEGEDCCIRGNES